MSVKTKTQFSSLTFMHVICLWRLKEMLPGLRLRFQSGQCSQQLFGCKVGRMRLCGDYHCLCGPIGAHCQPGLLMLNRPWTPSSVPSSGAAACLALPLPWKRPSGSVSLEPCLLCPERTEHLHSCISVACMHLRCNRSCDQC